MLIRLASAVCAAGIVTSLLAAAPFQAVAVSKASPIAGGGRTVGVATSVDVGGDAGATITQTAIDTTVQSGASTGLKPRQVLSKPRSSDIQLPVDGLTGKPQWTGRLAVKFRDELKVRADLVPSSFVRGADGQPVAVVSDLLSGFGGTARQLLRRTPEELRQLEIRSERYSGTAQADLAGLVYVDVSPERLLDAARAFNNLDLVEFVDIEREAIQAQGINQSTQYGCGTDGPGATSGVVNCYTSSPTTRCSALGGGNGCNNVAGCNNPAGATPTCRFGCNDPTCCATVGSILPACTDMNSGQGWDALCATYANVFCQSTVYDSLAAIAGNAATTPKSYKYDPCFAMRGPFDVAENSVLVQGGPQNIDIGVVPAPARLKSQLLTYEVDATSGKYKNNSLKRVTYTPGSYITQTLENEADPATGVPQQALPDPSLEGAYLALSAGCLQDHTFGGCSQVTCCVYVCRNDPSCCVIEWDTNCVALATAAPSHPDPAIGSPCNKQRLPDPPFPTSGTTPDMTGGLENFVGNARGFQVYTEGKAILAPWDPLPVTVPWSDVTKQVKSPTTLATPQTEPARDVPTSNVGTWFMLNSGFRGQGLDFSNLGEYETINAQLGINSYTKTRGQGMTVAVIDYSAFVNHEDLKNQVTAEPNQTQVLITSSTLNPDHGTAVLGVIGAERNSIGITGLAYGAALRFYPCLSVEEGYRLPNALTNAVIDLNEGDVIEIPLEYGSAAGVGLTVPADPVNFTLLTTANQAGITVVVPAGNQALPVKTSPDAGAGSGPSDSGAIVVGACWPGFQVGQLSPTPPTSNPNLLPGNNFCRWKSSNYSNTDAPGNDVHVSGWGVGVATTGYGDLFRGDSPSTDPLQVNQLRTYTAQGNGTSVASAMIAGWCTCLQSFSKTWFGATLSPLTMRLVVARPSNQYPQCGIPYSSPSFPGYPDNTTIPNPAQFGDTVAGGKQARIGGFPRTGTSLTYVITSTFGTGSNGSAGATPLTFQVISGVFESGNIYSIRDVDGASMRIGSRNFRAGTRAQGYGTVLYYPCSGQTTDLQLSIGSTYPPSSVTAMALNARSRVSWNTPAIEMVYFYNWNQKRWVSAGSMILSSQFTGTLFQPVGSLSDFTISSRNGGTVCYARVYTCSFGSASYSVLHDQLDLNMAVDIFGP